MTLRVLDLFSGIGGFSLGLEAAGMETVAFCEVSPICRHLLAHHWPKVPCYDDICTLTGERLDADGIAVDVICGGFPCQDLSYAGKGAGLAGARSGLWSEYARLIREIRPAVVIVENVSALLGRGLGRVLGDLAGLGYDAEWDCIRAADVGAPHLRNRLWIVAYARSQQHEGFGDAFRRALSAQLLEAATLEGLSFGDDEEADPLDPHADSIGSHRAPIYIVGGAELRDEQERVVGSMGQDVADAKRDRLSVRRRAGEAGEAGEGSFGVPRHVKSGLPVQTRALLADSDSDSGERLEPCHADKKVGAKQGGRPPRPRRARVGRWTAEPNVGRVAHGVPARVDRLHGLGNAIVPQIPEILGRAILQARAA